MLRIRVISQTNQATVLAIDGQLADGDVQVLAAELARHHKTATHLILKLDNVQFIDQDGLALLRPLLKAAIAAAGRLGLCPRPVEGQPASLPNPNQLAISTIGRECPGQVPDI